MPSFPRLKTSLKPSLRSRTARSSASPTTEIVVCFNRDGRRCSPFEALKLRVVQPTERLNSSGRFGWLCLVPPHPGAARCHNLPQRENSPNNFALCTPEPQLPQVVDSQWSCFEVHGQGTPHPVLRRVEALCIRHAAAGDSPSPRGRDRGEGEPTLETPMRLAAYPARV